MNEFQNLDINWIDDSDDDDKEIFLKALYSYLHFKKDSLEICDKIILKNPDFNAPKLLKIILILLTRDINKKKIAYEILKKINLDQINDHFKEYLIIISFWIKGDLHKVIEGLKKIISKYKKEILAVRLFHFNSIFIGIDGKFLENHQEIFGQWNKNDPFYNLILGMTSFAYEENNQLATAKNLAKESLDLSTKDLWSWHALLHVQDNELSSDLDKNTQFLSIEWTKYGAIKRHIWWHQALMHFYSKDYNACLYMYDKYIFSEDEFYLDFCNTSSLLLRLHYKGINVEDRMYQLKPLANYFRNQHSLPFIDYHLILFYKYFEDMEYFEKIEENIINGYKHSGFEKVVTCYLKPVIKNFKNNTLINTKVLNNAFQSLGGSFAQREIIMLGLLENSSNNSVKDKIKDIFRKKKSALVNYV